MVSANLLKTDFLAMADLNMKEYRSPECQQFKFRCARIVCASSMNADTGGQDSFDYSEDEIGGGWS